MLERIGKIKDPRNWTVVSSDNEVLGTAKMRKMQTMTSPVFADLLNAPPKLVIDAGEKADVALSADEVDEWLNFFGTGSAN
jgi:hypothetical protein